MDYTEQKIHTLNGYHGRIVNTRLDLISLPNGETALREVVEHPGGVTVLPVDEEGYVYCVRQFRYPFAEHLLEAPAGKLEKGEDPLACAVRELSEETGITADEYTFLGELYPSPGYSREVLYLYLARGLHYGKAHPDQNEFLDVERIHIDSLFELIMENKLKDGKTALAVLKARHLIS